MKQDEPCSPLDNVKYNRVHRWIAWAGAQGMFLSGFHFFIIVLAIPLLVKLWAISHYQVGLVAGAALLGSIFGSALLGYLTDCFGRKRMLMFTALIIILFSVLSAFAWNVWSLIIFRFLLGIGLGADYPITASYLCETIPRTQRAKIVAYAMMINCCGILLGVLTGYLCLLFYPHLDAWRIMFAVGILPAAFILLIRLNLPESPRWLLHRQQHDKAQAAIDLITQQSQRYTQTQQADSHRYGSLFNKTFLRVTLVSCSAWFLMDISYYGLGLFTPIVLQTLHLVSHGDFIQQVLLLAKATVVSNVFVLVGALLAIVVIDKISRLRLQAYGFMGVAFGLLLLTLSQLISLWHMAFIVLGVIIFNIAINIGPDITTYLIPAEVYPTSIRASGHGLATAAGKLGGFLGVVSFPLLQQSIGTRAILIMLFVLNIGGALLTHYFGTETQSKQL
jgi:MFS family permease